MNTTPERDERMGLPSASSMDRYAHCPGSWAAEKGLPDLPTEAVTQTGTNVHAAMETGNDEDLELTEKEIAARLREMESRETANFMVFYNCGGDVKTIREERFKIRDRATLEIVATARPDYCVKVGGYGLVLNYKTGFKDPTASELSWQARVEVISFWHEHFSEGVSAIRGGFLSSRLKSKCDTTDYALCDLQTVQRDLMQVLWKIQQPDAERVPGSHCRYCKAQSVCREVATYSLVASARTPLVGSKPDALAIVQAVSRMEPSEMAFVFRRKQIANVVFDAVEARLKTLPNEVLAPLGYTIAPGSNLKEIVDVATAFSRLSSLLTDAERVQVIKITRGKAAEILAARTGISKKNADDAILKALGDTVKEKIGEPKLKSI